MISKSIYSYPRIIALDAFRGLTIIGMILVNSQGNQSYPWLMHADWDGCTLADLVFPFFLFIVGFSAALALTRQGLNRKGIHYDIFKRSVVLFILGILLNASPFFNNWEHLRFLGILQRIALCYCLGALIYIHSNNKALLFIFISILLGYWFLMTQIPFDHFGILNPQENWAFYLDKLLLPINHLYKGGNDPEGLLSTLPSLATTLLGFLSANWTMSASVSNLKKCTIMLSVGLLCIVLGYLWSFNFPINKALWTSSYVLWTGGWALIVLCVLFILVDILGYEKLVFPFTIVGMNALFAFIFHVLLLKLQAGIHVPLANGQVVNLRVLITNYLFSGLSPENAALMYSIVFLLLNLLVVYVLYRKKIFIRV